MFYVRVAEVHTAIATDYVRVERTCACGTKATADVLVQTFGVAEAPFYVGGPEAADRARDDARRALPAAAHRNLGLARCPGCHRRDKGSVAMAVVTAALVPLIASILIFFAVWFAAMLVAAGAGAPKDSVATEVAIIASATAVTLSVVWLWTYLKWRKLAHWIDHVAVEFTT